MAGVRDIPDNLDPSLGLDLFRDITFTLSSFQPLNERIQPFLLFLLHTGILASVIDTDGQCFSVELLGTGLSVFLGGNRSSTRPDDSGDDGVIGE